MEATVENLIAWGVRINRESRNLTQAQLAARMGTKQSAISKLEDSDGGDVQLSKLIKAAHALDVALIVKFVSYPEFASLTRDVTTAALLAETFETAKRRASASSEE
ncbi:helix-turn-helix domain-containing protein [Variovorax paradoxus]|uniref:helix-turn-helix domain-containing protein n=1 Tax=Variovorax paradoxus TaxID=34073 RepID=UPI003D654358